MRHVVVKLKEVPAGTNRYVSGKFNDLFVDIHGMMLCIDTVVPIAGEHHYRWFYSDEIERVHVTP